jgi:5-methylcytosine-specific restriction protein A
LWLSSELAVRTFLFAWNPKKQGWADFDDDLKKFNRSGRLRTTWSVGNSKQPVAGDRFYMIRLGKEPKGILGSGFIRSRPFEGPDWKDPKKKARYVDIQFDGLVNGNEDVAITREELARAPFDEQHWDTEQSGIEISPDIAEQLETLWRSRYGIVAGGAVGEERVDAPSVDEGAKATTIVNRYERDPSARAECIRAHGTRCSVCDREMFEEYGPEARGLIHVHHLRPLGEVGDTHRLNPIRDLRPVCPNCHAVIHRRIPAYSIDDVRHLRKIALSGIKSPR